MSTHEQIPSFLAEMPEGALASYLNPGILPKPLPSGVATRAMTQAAAGEAEVTKTISGKRRIKLLEPAMEALVAQKAHTFLASMEVFQNPRTLERWTGDQPIRKTMWAKAVKKAGVRYRRPYQTRHTYASMMLSVGEHPMWVASQMGHSDWTMIARVYGR